MLIPNSTPFPSGALISSVLPPVDYLLVGHITHDLLPQGGYTVGGTASYAALTAARLRRHVGVLTSAGIDFAPSLFGDGIVVSCLPATATTTFENIYVNNHREQYVYAVAQPLTSAQLPVPWQTSPLVHIGPIFGECDPGLVAYFAHKTFVGITPQGWMRTSDDQGRVHRHPWHGATRVLSQASAVVFSIEDIEGDWDVAYSYAQQTEILVVTTGATGGELFVHGQREHFDALRVEEADPTGAGDIFASAFFIALTSSAVPIVAANFAACLASRSVARVRLASTPIDEDVIFCSTVLEQK
ncbi:MAG: ribokinase [Anaerolineae bacterium]|nr:ribokinase [Anaerolineae bacterium]